MATEWPDVVLGGISALSASWAAYLAYLAQRNTRTRNGVTVGEHVDNLNREGHTDTPTGE